MIKLNNMSYIPRVSSINYDVETNSKSKNKDVSGKVKNYVITGNVNNSESSTTCKEITRILPNLNGLKRKAIQAQLKSLRPEECLNDMTCLIGSKVAGMFDVDSFKSELSTSSKVTYEVVTFTEPCVKWCRKQKLLGSDQHCHDFKLGAEYHDEPHMLLVLPVNEFVALVNNKNGSSATNISNCLTEWVSCLKSNHPNFNLYIVCIGLKKYCQQMQTMENKEYKKAINHLSNKKEVPSLPVLKCGKQTKKLGALHYMPSKIEDVLVELQLTSGIEVIPVENENEFITLLHHMSKAIAETPFKRMKRQNIHFVDEKSSVKVNSNTGEGTKQVWSQMLMQFHNVSPDVASAITSRYSSFNELLLAYQRHDRSTGEKLLSNIVIRRGVGNLENQRKIGQKLSERIYKMMTSVDGCQLLY